MKASEQKNDTVAREEATVTRLKKYAVIAGERVALPIDAKFYFQDKRGLWFWSTRKPRVMEGDWTPNKSPVQINTEQGFRRCLVTTPMDASRGAWRNTVTAAVNPDNRPKAMSPEVNDLLVVGGD